MIMKPTSEQNSSSKKGTWILIILVLLNLATFGVYLKNRQDNITLTEKNTYLVSDQEALKAELEAKIKLLDTMHTDNAQLNEKLQEQKVQIEKYLVQFEKNKKDLKFLVEARVKLKEYEALIQKLRAENQSLIDQNTDLANKNGALAAENDSLQKEKLSLIREKELLANKLGMAAGLQAFDFQIQALHVKPSGKYSVVQKAKKVNSIKTCFSLSENLLVNAGEKLVYLRIINPKSNVLVSDQPTEKHNFQASNGAEMSSSEQRVIDYNNKALEVCLFWNNKPEVVLEKGEYNFEVWVEGKLIGKSKLKLK